ncbi:MAG TPA: hypothetical protein VNG33_18020 [Polyangiaceae bacterium]|nr:hypothetical protein [Polyangiaceae bacterium]
MDQSHQEVATASSVPGKCWARARALLLLLPLLGACSSNSSGGAEVGAGGDGAGAGAPSYSPDLPYARSVEAFEPGDGAGYNQAKLPDIVLGPPLVTKDGVPSLDVLSLGSGGEIVLGFGEHVIVDGPGPDLVVFENPFWPGGNAAKVFAELGEVSVSDDGESWQTFPCDTTGDGAGHFAGCAGVTPTLAYDPVTLVPLDPAQTGGDTFDLADLGLPRVRFVKIHDLQTLPPAGMTSGFDLDAVGIVNVE